MSTNRKTTFKLPYAGFDRYGGLDLLYSDSGDFSAVLSVTNPVLQYSADPAGYNAVHATIQNLIAVLGQGYMIQKQDVFIRRRYQPALAEDYLQQQYGEHFRDREYTAVQSYLVITRQVKRGAFYVFNQAELEEFSLQIGKVTDLLTSGGFQPRLLSAAETNTYLMSLLSMDFTSGKLVLDNIKSGDQHLEMGGKSMKCISLVDTDQVNLPEEIGTYRTIQPGKSLHDFPADNLDFLMRVPGYQVMVYNQVIEVPLQQLTLNRLELKRKRHSGIPDPANNICVEDIDRLLTDVARENQLLVNAHYTILVCTGKDQLAKPVNFIETELFRLGIVPSRNAYNQLELFRTALPGNAIELKTYDWFLTTLDAACCLLFRESLPIDEVSDFLLRFTDRQGIPVAIDPSDLPMRTGRINARNRFCLGP
ncbi:hypothetical protein HDC92_004343 [Pedobacter sp. AK017]|uniref:hypothetical protein n=1 Tax=Pedobacter sp. AK017 TaxID=2723073 RepID=UPI0018279CC8|nr:hypothetical protein [Pedobacter sp. AK017]MBB5440640.1 hypothetical protein [Pedobacter sp. AK017]